ncbi:hypothetical protein TanjilG_27218 [Lupinus angustifolius]|uniref:AP2/ERF domain-containing protein n=1 Tax=Lupinus angustifolius TaxID=3871 RepID=A0A394D8E0_LUPAN|nr:PREDICTED: AP2-like ethylene-responsive transcription factor At1g16060 isoform X2 [Lupinus angustifolius]OIW19852.1 hypothetical protein TanjilG_27218 [Lupinus angustifolius]
MAKLSQQQPQKNNASNDNNNKNLNATKNLTTKVKRTRRSVPRDSPPQRSSIYRGVTRHRWTGRYEAHLWDKNCWNESQNKKGRQGAYDDEETAAHAYDLAALKYWGQETTLNFPLPTYENEVREMDDISREEYIGSLRRKSSGFSRGISKYRGVARHHHNGRWEARIGRVFGNKYLYLGTYATQEEAATAYDIAAIEYRGLNAITNFDLSHYINWLKPNNNDTNIIKYNIVDSNPIVCDRNITPYPNQEMGCNFFNNQEKSFKNGEDQTTMTQTRLADAASTLGLLMTSNSTLLESELLSCIFPDEIQTYFDCEDYSKYGESDDLMFNELESYLPPIFHFDDFDICLK